MIPFRQMERPETREDFEMRLNYLLEYIKKGKYHFPKDSGLAQSLMNIRYLPNGRIDMLSIDETARLQANSIYTFRDFQPQNIHPDQEDTSSK